MITKFHVLDENGDLVTVTSTQEEAFECIQQLSVAFPEKQYTIEEQTHSSVTPGFGRDPDLH